MIGAISESLKNVLEEGMSPTVPVTLLAPGDPSSRPTRVNLFLYSMEPHPHLRNLEPTPDPGDPTRLLPPPLALVLNYLVTAYAPSEEESGQAAGQSILADAVRVLHENGVVPSRFLEPGLLVGEVKVSLRSVDIEELSKIWTALDQSYRLSVVHQVSVALVPLSQAQRRPAAPPVAVTNVEVSA